MALTTGKRDGWPYADLHVKPYAQRHVKVYADRAALEVNPATVARVRMRYVAAGLEAAVYRKPPARSYRRRLDGEQEARLVALTCSAPPQGHKRWTSMASFRWGVEAGGSSIASNRWPWAARGSGAGHRLAAPGRHGAVRPQPGGLNQTGDHAAGRGHDRHEHAPGCARAVHIASLGARQWIWPSRRP
jgi:hypothetical protein